MAFDFTKLDGYREDMTAEEKLDLLKNWKPAEPDLSGYIKKELFDKKVSELAEIKKQLKEKMTEDERKEAERLEAEAALKAEVEALRKEKTVSDSKSRFLALGYDETLATETAKALADGDMEKVFANQQIYIENVRKAERAALLAGDPKPPAGTPGGTVEITKEQFDAMNYSERLKLFNEQPETYKKFTEG
jgi:hypothetical protein